jgi:HK97 family phage prohead protease
MTESDVRYLSCRLAAAAPTDDVPQGILEGYASVFDVPYSTGRTTREVIKAGAFAESLKKTGGVMPLFYEHRWGDGPIGVVTASEDETGLRVRAEVFMDDPRGRNVWRATLAGAFDEWSIGYLVDASKSVFASDSPNLEQVFAADVLESSVVVKGANPGTFMTRVAGVPAPDLETEEVEVVETIEVGTFDHLAADAELTLAALRDPAIRAAIAEDLQKS